MVNAPNRVRSLLNRREGNSIGTLLPLVPDTPNFYPSELLSLETIEMRFLLGVHLIFLCYGVRCPHSTERVVCRPVLPWCLLAGRREQSVDPAVWVEGLQVLSFWSPVGFSRQGLFYDCCHCHTVQLSLWRSERSSLQNTVIRPSVTSVTEGLPSGHGDLNVPLNYFDAGLITGMLISP